MNPRTELWLQADFPATDDNPTILCGRDKSLTHRAIMFASLARGSSRIETPLLGADCQSTMACFRALGVMLDASQANSVHVLSPGFRMFHSPSRDLDCGNSGTTARLLTGILAALPGIRCRLTGDASLSSRPMRRVVDPLRRAGARIEGADQGNFLPLTLDGQVLSACHHEIDKASAQVKSALLFAGLLTQGDTEISLPAGSRDHTERMLLKMGAPLEITANDNEEKIRLKGPFFPKADIYRIPVDPSSAAFFVVFGLLRSRGTICLPEVLNNPTRTGFLRALERMSSGISQANDAETGFVEPTMTLRVEGGLSLHGTVIAAHEVPSLIDEVPILAVAAAFAQGPSHFSGLGELRIKESDRLAKTAELLQLAGAEVHVQGDELFISGGLREVRAFRYDPLGDHRLAMAAAVLARCSEKPCCILDPDCVGVSFPNFYELLASVSNEVSMLQKT